VRADKVFSEKEREDFLAREIVVEEKIDGANLGVFFDKDGELHLLNRGSYLFPPFTGQWKKIGEWLSSKWNVLFDTLGIDKILFGEWCYAKHSVAYDALPDWFLSFDIFDKTFQRFWSVSRRKALLKESGIFQVPELARGVFNLRELESFMSKSRVSNESLEGLYLRRDEGDWLCERAKLVRPAFIQAIEEHWSRAPIHPNRLAGGYGNPVSGQRKEKPNPSLSAKLGRLSRIKPSRFE
jgi:ATP-dependent RNA circularization protein (DNA/RNA ligase family)